jgi:hypothetical protein
MTDMQSETPGQSLLRWGAFVAFIVIGCLVGYAIDWAIKGV